MSNRIPLTVVISCLALAACSIGEGAVEGALTYRYANCAVRNVQLVDAGNKPIINNVVPMGATFQIAATGVQNFIRTDGKAYPACELSVKDKFGKTIARMPDVLESSAKDGINTPGPLDLSATITMTPPLKSGETYKIIARFFDKKDVKSEVVAEVVVLLEDG